MKFNYKRETVKTVLNMAIPAIIESFFVALVGLVDSYMVSSLGANAVAAVGLTTQPKFIGLCSFLAINIAVSALVARRLGEGKKREANRILSTSLVFVFILAVIISIVAVCLASPIIRLCGSAPETHDDAVTYFRIIMGCMIFNCFQMNINSAMRGAGNTRITMQTNITSNIVNVIFNYLLIEGHFGFPALGIAGAATATVIGTVVAFVMSVISITKRDFFISLPYLIKEKIYPAWKSFVSIISVAYSIFIEQIFLRIGFIATSIMMAHQGTGAMAAHQVGMNILGLTFSFGDGLQAAAVALIGRSLGEQKPEKAKEYGATCRIIGALIALVVAIVYFAIVKPLMRSFFDDADIVVIGAKIMYIAAFVTVFQIQQVVYMGSLRGAGDVLYTAVISAVCVTGVRTSVSYFLGYTLSLGVTGIWLGILADQLARYFMSASRYKKGKWMKIKI